MKIFDAHSHAFPDRIAAGAIASLTAGARWVPVKARHDGTAAGLLNLMDKCGIEKTILCSVATRPGQTRAITDWSTQVASERIIPFASIHPDFDEPEQEVRRIADLGLRGLKFHPQYMNCAADDSRLVRIARAAADAGLSLAIHAGYDLAFDPEDIASPRRIANLHAAAPRLRLLACHLGGWRQWEESLEYLAGKPVYLETSYCFGDCPPELIEHFVKKHPKDYLLFGTDAPWADPAEELRHFRTLPLDETDMCRALWDNAERFVKSE